LTVNLAERIEKALHAPPLRPVVPETAVPYSDIEMLEIIDAGLLETCASDELREYVAIGLVNSLKA